MRHPLATAALLAAVLAAIAPAKAARIYKFVDEHGVTHYTDRKPDHVDPGAIEEIKVRAERRQVASLRIDGAGERRRALAWNELHGPVEIELVFADRLNMGAEPALPMRTVLPPRVELPVAEIRRLDPRAPARFSLSMNAVPGDPAAAPEDVPYQLPVDASFPWRIDQGFGGDFSHTEPQSRYAIDINVDEGTPVLAARGGTVMQLEDDFEGAGLDREKYGGRANHVRILHGDGSMAVYAHLLPESVLVGPGQVVSAGQQLGASGNTGFSTGPHLHFAVQVNRGMRLESIPFRLVGPTGPVAIPGG